MTAAPPAIRAAANLGPSLGQRRGQDEEPVLAEPRDRRVHLDPAALVAQEGVDDPARLDVEVGRYQPLQAVGAPGPAPRTSRTSTGRTAHAPPASPVPPRRRRGTTTGPRSRSAPSVPRRWLERVRRSQPAGLPERAPASRIDGERHPPHFAPRPRLLPRQCISLSPPSDSLGSARRANRRRLSRVHPPDIDFGQIHRRVPGDDPLGRRPPDAWPEMIPWELRLAATNSPSDSGTNPSWKLESGVNLFGRPQEVGEADRLQLRYAHPGRGQRWREVVPVRTEFHEPGRRDGDGAIGLPFGSTPR